MDTNARVRLSRAEGYVAVVEFGEPPHNYFDLELLETLADTWEQLDRDPSCRAIVLASKGRNFCAGRNFSASRKDDDSPANLYRQGVRMMACGTPWIAAVQGGALGGGMGLAMSADFRVIADDAYFTANFAQLGYHHGFGLTATLPWVIGNQAAAELLLTGRKVRAEEAIRLGLADRAVPGDSLLEAATAFAAELAGNGPLAVTAIRRTLRSTLVDRMRAAVELEASAQDILRQSEDFREGVAAAAQRRKPEFTGR